MAYIGNIPAEAYTNTVKDSFNGNGSTTAFTLSRPTVTNDVRVVVENVIQDPTVAYSVSGTTLTFTSAPPAGTGNIYVVHLGPAVMTAIPPSEIADATTFASSVTVQGAFTSLGIDDNATSTAMTLDTSGNLLVGKASNAFGTTGVALNPDGSNNMTRASDPPLALNRLTSDGSILGFYKDGTTVGTIGTGSGVMAIAGPSGNGLSFPNNLVLPATSSAGAKDASTDLGVSYSRFKDLYLSGGVYLGGTGSANKLDDYEEGTWTPAWTSVTNPSYTLQLGYYTRVGRLVTFHMSLQWNGGTSIGANVGGLPFAVQNSNQMYFMSSTYHDAGITYGSGRTTLVAYPVLSQTYLQLNANGSAIAGIAPTIATGGTLYATGFYYAA